MLDTYHKLLEEETKFNLRHAIERLREGLFDPVAVRLLTAHEKHLNKIVDQGLHSTDSGKSAHLCVCGSYGQGKSHSLTYVQDRALQKGFVSSMMNLDLREIPLTNFRQVYKELISNIKFPGSDLTLAEEWKSWANKQETSDNSKNLLSFIPKDMPHLFKSVLVGMIQKNISLSKRERRLKKNAKFNPREFSYLIEKALCGDVLPVSRLRNVLKYRQVSFYRDNSLVCRGVDPYIQMIRSLAVLFRKMGYKGWVILFDEGESITQLRILARSKSYQILQQLLYPEKPITGLYPVFAFTEDFFEVVRSENYEKIRIRKEVEELCFNRNYAEIWDKLTIHHLQDLTQKEWEDLSEKLLHLYAKAYNWSPSLEQTRQEINRILIESEGQETRYRLKTMIHQLDLIHQEYF